MVVGNYATPSLFRMALGYLTWQALLPIWDAGLRLLPQSPPPGGKQLRQPHQIQAFMEGNTQRKFGQGWLEHFDQNCSGSITVANKICVYVMRPTRKALGFNDLISTAYAQELWRLMHITGECISRKIYKWTFSAANISKTKARFNKCEHIKVLERKKTAKMSELSSIEKRFISIFRKIFYTQPLPPPPPF